MLHGIRVLDISRVLAGPLCGMMLGDLGADVIKVERPGTGDETRGWGPPFDDRGEAAYYLSINRNKLGVTLDLDAAADRDRLATLIEGADVVVDNFRSGTLERRGLDPRDFLERAPRLIWCTITGFGPQSPRPGYDFVVQAESGWMSVTGAVDGEPTKAGIALADVMAGKDAAIAVLAALARRGLANDATFTPAESRRLFVSLAGTAVAALVNVAQNAMVSGHDARRWGNGHANLVPYQLFHAVDRPLVIAVGNDAQWQACCRALMLAELGADPALRTNAGRLEQRQHVVDAISRRLRDDSAAAWIAALDGEGVPCGVVRTVREALSDVEASALTGVAPSVPGTVRLPPPTLGEHDTLVREHGWDAFDAVARARPAAR